MRCNKVSEGFELLYEEIWVLAISDDMKEVKRKFREDLIEFGYSKAQIKDKWKTHKKDILEEVKEAIYQEAQEYPCKSITYSERVRSKIASKYVVEALET